MFFNKKNKRFSQYYNEFFEKIYNYIFFRVGNNRQMAEEFTQEVFLKAYENFDDFDENATFSAWIYRIAHNHIIDHYRKKKTNTIDLDTIVNMINYSKHADETFVKNTDIKIEMKNVLKALESLNDQQKNLIILRYIEEYEIEEMAEIVKESANYVRVNLHRALQKLNSILTDFK